MDKFYKTVPKEKLTESGYLEESFSLSKYLNLRSLDTPLFKIKKEGKKSLVLLSTGSFSPLHEGHIEMMEEARRQAENAGYNVIAGYLSPSHDTYLRSKLGKDFMTLPERLNKIEDLIKDNSWLMLDKFESLLPAPCNFTSVIIRLELFLNQFISDFKIAYVYGSDNQSFGYAFSKEGMAFCVERDGHPIKLNFNNVTNCPKTNFSEISSTLIRNKKYLIRQEEKSPIFAVRYEDYQDFCKDLKKILSNYFPAEIVKAKTSVNTTLPTISLDSYFKGDFNLKVSRQFHLDSQAKPSKLIARPGNERLETQVYSIPKGEYCLVDDDKASGTTVALAKQILSHCQIKEEEFLINTKNALDIVDARDFLFGATDGGLVIEEQGVAFRSPYIFPFVNLTTRAKVPASKALELSSKIINLNLLFFTKYPEIKIIDIPEVNQAFFILLGFRPNQTILECLKEWRSYES